ncbi:MAG: FGGY-family carbohydrate kinase [Pirellulales bacterium]|nr:FGGY-family carbohydrate kinase [Pirellulales bacterium]
MTRNDHETSYVLALDLGSGGPKVALVSERGEILASTRRSTTTYLVGERGVEQDPEEWWSTISDAAREILARQLVPRERIIAVACTSQWSVTTPVDAEGRALMRAVHWMDGRGAPYTKAMTDGLVKISGYSLPTLVRWIRNTGGVPTHSGNDVLAHLLFIKHECPDVYRQAEALLEPMDYINLRLTGRTAASHATIFPYLLTDNRRNPGIVYADSLIKAAGLDRAKLPELLPVDTILGTVLPAVAQDWGLSPQTQVVMGMCDTHAAALGSGAVADGEVHVCIGTSSWITCHVPFKRTDLFRYIATMPSALKGKNMVVCEVLAAGKCVELFVKEWFADHFTAVGGDRYAEFERLASSAPPGCEGLVFLPWLGGSGPPTSDSTARGGFMNWSLRTTRAQAARAVLEGIAYNLRWALEAVERFIGKRQPQLRFIGGGAQSALWCQILADVLDRPIVQVAEPNQSIARGAALSAFVALGKLRVEELSQRVALGHTYRPDARRRDLYERVFREFQKFYHANKPIFGRLNTPPAE